MNPRLKNIIKQYLSEVVLFGIKELNSKFCGEDKYWTIDGNIVIRFSEDCSIVDYNVYKKIDIFSITDYERKLIILEWINSNLCLNSTDIKINTFIPGTNSYYG